MKDSVIKDSSEVLIIKPILNDNQVLKPKQFKIETPIITVESDTDNHFIDIASVVVVIIVFFIFSRLLKKWVK
jgi:hypothetical protein